MDRQLRVYTKRRLKPGRFENFFSKLSITNWIILINVIVYLLMFLFIGILGAEKTFLFFALQPTAFFFGYVWTLLSSMFMHSPSNIGHLLFNMLSLFFVGNFVEKIIGRKRFLWFYLISGIFAGFFHAALTYFFGVPFILSESLKIGSLNWFRFGVFGSPEVFSVGASGAIFGLLGLLAVLIPNKKIYLIAGPLLAIVVQAMLSSIFPGAAFLEPLNLLIIIYFFVSIFSIFSLNPTMRKISLPLGMPLWLLPIVAIVPLVVIGLFVLLPIGNMAHLGGLLVGLAYGNHLRKKYPKKARHLSRTLT